MDLTLFFLSPRKTKRPFFHKKNNHTSLISTIVEQLRPCFVDQRTTPPIQERPLFHCAPIKRHESSRDQTRKNKGIKVYQPTYFCFYELLLRISSCTVQTESVHPGGHHTPRAGVSRSFQHVNIQSGQGVLLRCAWHNKQQPLSTERDSLFRPNSWKEE